MVEELPTSYFRRTGHPGQRESCLRQHGALEAGDLETRTRSQLQPWLHLRKPWRAFTNQMPGLSPDPFNTEFWKLNTQQRHIVFVSTGTPDHKEDGKSSELREREKGRKKEEREEREEGREEKEEEDSLFPATYPVIWQFLNSRNVFLQLLLLSQLNQLEQLFYQKVRNLVTQSMGLS